MSTPIYDQIQAIRAYTTGVLRARAEYNKHPFADGHRHPGPNDDPPCRIHEIRRCTICIPTLSVAADTINPTQPEETQP